MDRAAVMAWAVLDEAVRPTGRTRHVAHGKPVGPVSRLVLARLLAFQDPGVYLFYCDEQWTVLTDTLHDDMKRAQDQAEFEYEGIDSRWVYLPPPDEREDPRRQTHRTIFRFDTAFLDAANFVAAEEAFEHFRRTVPDGLRIAVDFGQVEVISEVWPVLPMGQAGSRVQGHCIVCMRVSSKIREVFELLGLSNTPGYEYIDDGVCPSCGGPFDNGAATCSNCGRFAVETYTWRPRA